MNPDTGLLDRVRIASPCPASWADMQGDDQVRFCRACKLNVYNLSSMTRSEAERLISDREGRLCVTYYERPDGTVLTADCPIGLRAARRQLARLVVGLAALLAVFVDFVVVLGGGAAGSGKLRVRQVEPFKTVSRWLAPPPVANPNPQIAGRIALPVLQPQPPQERLMGEVYVPQPEHSQ